MKRIGFTTIAKLKEVENPNKLHQELCGYNKKNKLGLKNPTINEIKNWIKEFFK